ncbi:MAG: hypothetical protein AAFW98_01405 [Pseudomonadota bacterium]
MTPTQQPATASTKRKNRLAGEPTLFFHIGQHKTGTTSIQAFCKRNRKLLTEAGLAYPPFANANHSTMMAALFRDPTSRGTENTDKRLLREKSEDLAAALSDYLGRMARKGLSVLVSGEGLSIMTPVELERVQTFAARHYPHMVVVGLARPPLAFARSSAQQRLRNGRTFASFLNKVPAPRYAKRFGPSVEVFGRANVRLAAYHPSLLRGGDALQGVLDLMGCDEPSLTEARSGRANTAMSLTAAKALSAYNESVRAGRPVPYLPPAILERWDHPTVAMLHGGYTRHVSLPEPAAALLLRTLLNVPGPRYRLAKEIVNAVRAESVEDVAWLKDTFGIDIAPLDEPEGDTLTLAEMAVFDDAEIAAVTSTFDAFIADPDSAIARVTKRLDRKGERQAERSLKRLRGGHKGHA